MRNNKFISCFIIVIFIITVSFGCLVFYSYILSVDNFSDDSGYSLNKQDGWYYMFDNDGNYICKFNDTCCIDSYGNITIIGHYIDYYGD